MIRPPVLSAALFAPNADRVKLPRPAGRSAAVLSDAGCSGIRNGRGEFGPSIAGTDPATQKKYRSPARRLGLPGERLDYAGQNRSRRRLRARSGRRWLGAPLGFHLARGVVGRSAMIS